MDTLKILLGATVALLLAALGLSWKNLQAGSDPAEVAKQQVELKKLEIEKEKLELEKLRLSSPQGYTPPPVVQATPSAPEPPSASELADAQAKIQELEEEKAKAARDSSVKDEENRFLMNRTAQTDKQSRRMAMIQQATLMGNVVEWVDSPDAGSFATIQIVSPENVQPGTELLIRRNGGILGKLRVDRIEPEGTIANPVTRFSGAKPVQGDELILEPPFVGPIDDSDPSGVPGGR